jgi:chromosome segregation ATPase
MSDTPRTDNEIVGELLVFASFARKLERELAAVTEERDRYKIALDKYSEDEATNTLLGLKEQRDELRKHLQAANKGAERNMHALNSAIANRLKAERELAEMTEQRDRVSTWMSDVRDVICDALPDVNAPTKEMAIELIEQRDRLAEALRIVMADYRLDGRVSAEADILVCEALASVKGGSDD